MDKTYDFYTQDIADFHLPRWNEFPEIELYIDQVTTFLQSNLLLFYPEAKTSFLTPSMINNYVKQGILERPEKKKYNRSHLAHLFVICILKRLFSIADIGKSISCMKKEYSVEDGYNLFCEELEHALRRAFGTEAFPKKIADEEDSRSITALKAISQAFASLVLSEQLLALREQ